MKSFNIIFFILTILLFSNFGWAQNAKNLISVSGTAEMEIEPNLLYVNIESWSRANTSKKAQDLQAEQYEKVKKVFDRMKIKKDDIRTNYFTNQPDYTYDSKAGTSKVTGYRVSHSLRVTVRALDTAGEFLDALAQMANGEKEKGVSVSGLDWDHDKKDQFENTVIQEAVKKAKNKADVLAAAANVKVKSVHRMNYNSNHVVSLAYDNMAASESGFAAKSMSYSPKTEVARRMIKVSASVSIDYEI